MQIFEEENHETCHHSLIPCYHRWIWSLPGRFSNLGGRFGWFGTFLGKPSSTSRTSHSTSRTPLTRRSSSKITLWEQLWLVAPAQLVAPPTQLVAPPEMTKIAAKSPFFASLCVLQVCQCIMRPWRGLFGLYRSTFKKKLKHQTHFQMLHVLAFNLTLFFKLHFAWNWFLSVFTWFFLQVDSLMDSEEETRVVAGILKIFEDFPYFCHFHMTLGLKTEFLKPR